MIRFGWLLFCLLLCACQSQPVSTRTVQVKIPVAVSCVKLSDIPERSTLETSRLRKEDSLFLKAQLLLIDFKSLQAEVDVLRTLLEACVLEETVNGTDR